MVESKTGLKIQVDESVNAQSGSSAFRPQASDSAPRIVVKRRIGDKVDVSYGSTIGASTGRRSEVNAEMHVSPDLSVTGVWNNNDANDTQNSSSFGVDLKVEKRFK